MRTVELLEDYRSFLAAEPFWDALARSSGDSDSPFVSFDWLRLWWESFGRGKRLCIPVIRQDGEPVAAVPLMEQDLSWRGLPARTLTCIGLEQSGRTAVVGEASAAEGCLGLALRHLRERRRFDMVWLDGLTEEPSGKERDEEIAAAGFGSLKLTGMNSPYIRITRGWQEYLAGRSRNLREKIKRTEKHFREGKTELSLVREAANVAGAMEKVLAISRETWKYREGTAIASDPRAAEFYARFARVAARKGMLKLMLVEYGGRPVAFTYELKYKGRDYFLKTGFDLAFSRLSPGIFILSSSIHEAFDTGCLEYDLLGSDEDYKMKFTDLTRPHCKYRLFNTTAYGRLLHAVEMKAVPVLKRLLRVKRETPVKPRQPSHSLPAAP